MNPDTNNEVARLRELLNLAIEIAAEAIEAITPLERSEYSRLLYRQLERLRDEVARLSAAPEESAPDHLGDTNKMIPEWREQEMPLDDELKDIDQYADKQNDFHTCRVFQSIEFSLHYLRDEIEQLKKNQSLTQTL